MLLLKFIRKLFKILNGDTSPVEIGLGFVLGMFLGLAPMKTLLALVFLLLFLVLKANFASMLFGLAVFKLLGVAFLDVISKAIGRGLLVDCAFLHGFWQWLVNLPLVSFMELNDTLVMGGLALGVVLAVPVYFLVTRGVRRYRERQKSQMESKFDKWLKKVWIVKLLKWLLIGSSGGVA